MSEPCSPDTPCEVTNPLHLSGFGFCWSKEGYTVPVGPEVFGDEPQPDVVGVIGTPVRSIENEVYEAAAAAAEKWAEIPSWLISVIVNATVDAYVLAEGPSPKASE